MTAEWRPSSGAARHLLPASGAKDHALMRQVQRAHAARACGGDEAPQARVRVDAEAAAAQLARVEEAAGVGREHARRAVLDDGDDRGRRAENPNSQGEALV